MKYLTKLALCTALIAPSAAQAVNVDTCKACASLKDLRTFEKNRVECGKCVGNADFANSYPNELARINAKIAAEAGGAGAGGVGAVVAGPVPMPDVLPDAKVIEKPVKKPKNDAVKKKQAQIVQDAKDKAVREEAERLALIAGASSKNEAEIAAGAGGAGAGGVGAVVAGPVPMPDVLPEAKVIEKGFVPSKEELKQKIDEMKKAKADATARSEAMREKHLLLKDMHDKDAKDAKDAKYAKDVKEIDDVLKKIDADINDLEAIGAEAGPAEPGVEHGPAKDPLSPAVRAAVDQYEKAYEELSRLKGAAVIDKKYGVVGPLDAAETVANARKFGATNPGHGAMTEEKKVAQINEATQILIDAINEANNK